MKTPFLWPVILAILSTTGCMHPLPPTSWRLAPDDVLTPPGVSGPNVAQNVVQTDAPRHPACPSTVRVKGKHIKVTLIRAGLSNEPPGWLTSWAEDLEAQGCIQDGQALRLASQLAESVPLDINEAFRLLYPNDQKTVPLNPGVRLQIMTPIVQDGVAPDAPFASDIVEADETSVCDAQSGSCALNLNGRLTDKVPGYEIALYSVQSKSRLPGVSVVAVSAERHINGNVQHAAQPIHDYFQSLSAAHFYEVFYKAGETEFTALLVGGVSKADLERRTKLLEMGIASCETLNNEMCVTVPKRVAINPKVVVTVNGNDTTLNWGATVNAAIRTGGEQQPNVVLPHLSLLKPYGDRLAPVEFDPANPSILNLILMGGESISWK